MPPTDEGRGVTLRPYQKLAVERVLRALERRKSVVLSMPTGSGKTLVALVAALRYSGGGGISVFTRTIAEYQAWEREARRLGVHFSGHVGRDRVCRFGPNTPQDGRGGVGGGVGVFRPLLRCHECPENLLRTHQKARGPGDGSDGWAGVLGGSLVGELEEMQRLGVEAWVQAWRSREKGCGYPFARDAPTPLKLYTHLTYFLLWRYVGSPTEIYVFDEAHNLAGITRSLTFTLTGRMLAALIEQYEDIKKFGAGLGVGGKLSRQLDSIDTAIDFLSKLYAFARWERGDLPQPPELVFEGDERLLWLASQVRLVLERPDVWRTRRVVVCTNPSCRAENPEGTHTCATCGSRLEGDRPENRAVRLVPLDPSFLLRRLNSDRWIMLSGSMPNPRYLAGVMGLANFEVVELDPFKKSVKYYLDEELDMSYHARGKVREKAVSKVLGIAAKGGVTLVVTQNYEEVGWFRGHAHIAESPNTTIREVERLVEERCEAGKPTLIVGVARGKLFEGVEFKHRGRSALSRVVLLGVPYPNTQDEDFRDMAEYLEEKRGVRIWELLLEDAAITSKQAMGRAIRGPEDRAEIYFLDKRFKRLFPRIGVTEYTTI